MAGPSDPEGNSRPVATIGLLVTLPSDWTSRMGVEVQCPHCSDRYHAGGSGALNEVATFINNHRCRR